jgi:ABC-2 type transport system ATP-binding protein
MGILEIKKLAKMYKHKVLALNQLSLSLRKGVLYGFLGPNGAGKTTTINILAGFVRKDSGTILFDGEEIHDDDYEHKKHFGFVLDQPIYFEKLSAREYLEFVATMYGLERQLANERIQELIEFLDLQGKGREWIETYSAGMKKKIALAAAIIHHPTMLILDEPLESIDPISARHIKEVIKQMVRTGATVLMSSHNLDTVEKLCDEIIIINNGRLVLQAENKDIHKKLSSEISQSAYQSLEEIFVDVVSDKNEEKPKGKLSWL